MRHFRGVKKSQTHTGKARLEQYNTILPWMYGITLRQPEPRKSSYSPCSSIADDQETKALSNKRTTTGCSGSNTSGSIAKPLQHLARGGPGAVLRQETGARATGRVAVSELSRALVAGAGATRHVMALEQPCARRWEPQDTRACAHVFPFIFDLKLIRGGTRSSGYRQWPPSPPQERLQSLGWG
jgi:hypothetical protein